jgi:hypothetical protein
VSPGSSSTRTRLAAISTSSRSLTSRSTRAWETSSTARSGRERGPSPTRRLCVLCLPLCSPVGATSSLTRRASLPAGLARRWQGPPLWPHLWRQGRAGQGHVVLARRPARQDRQPWHARRRRCRVRDEQAIRRCVLAVASSACDPLLTTDLRSDHLQTTTLPTSTTSTTRSTSCSAPRSARSALTVTPPMAMSRACAPTRRAARVRATPRSRRPR